ncbi:MAG: hypothetical protein CL907_00080 [Dehalococcoidia bacterium]|nr:hypothetical protein [Dehalococcoidia bacterium]|tara:strand:- start:2478 stop:3380 length:903 start_codon:yes stop_codon:yes gene_type:complete
MSLKLSLGLPVYNEEKYIEKTLDSIKSQTFLDYELIISDNNSSDKSLKIIEKYAQNDNRIRVIKNKKNIGMINNFNKVLFEANNDYFVWIGAHDIYKPDFLEALVRELKNNDLKPKLIFSDVSHIDIDEKIINKEINAGFESNRNFFSRSITLPWIIKGSGDMVYGLFNTKVLKKIGGFSNLLWADVLLIHQIAYKGYIIKVKKILRLRRYKNINSYKNWKDKYINRTNSQRNYIKDKVTFDLYFPNLMMMIFIFWKIGIKNNFLLLINLPIALYWLLVYLFRHRVAFMIDLINIIKRTK